jgi:5,10-methylene-tetrahydrofolate dehydrogenase/methenyl tetrahydrofolate cyclohydrolase
VPKLGIIQIANRFDSDLFVAAKIKRCQSLGFDHCLIQMPEFTSKGALISRAGGQNN